MNAGRNVVEFALFVDEGQPVRRESFEHLADEYLFSLPLGQPLSPSMEFLVLSYTMAMGTSNKQSDELLPFLFNRTKEVIKENWFAYAFLAPTLVFLVLVVWLPFLRGVWISFHEWPFIGQAEWVGLQNYRYLLQWEAFFTGLKATVIFSTSTIMQLGLALAAAVAVKNISRFKNVISSSFLLPYTIPPIATGAIWLFILSPTLGPLFEVLTNLGILKQPLYWQSTGDLALASIIFVTGWTFWPFMFLILSATLESIPDEHYETAKVYGASRWQMFTRITLPQLKSALLIIVSIRIVWNLAKVAQPFLMTSGGPGYQTSVLGIFLYRFAYVRGQMGMAFAIGIILLLISAAFIVLLVREFEKDEIQEAM